MKFYIIENSRYYDNNFAFGEQINPETGDFQKCEKCGNPISMRKWIPPFNVKLSKYSFGDFVFGDFITFLVSEDFKNKYSNSKLNGISRFEKVVIKKVNKEKKFLYDIPDYYYVILPVSKIFVDENKSKYKRNGAIECESCRVGGVIESMNGVFIDESTWDGKDIFFPINLSGTIIISERFKNFIDENGFTNIEIIPAEKYIPSWIFS